MKRTKELALGINIYSIPTHFTYNTQGDTGMKRELVDSLVATLTTGKTSNHTETERKDDRFFFTFAMISRIQGATFLLSLCFSEIIPEGALGSAPESIGGGGLSTYKELCSVANELVMLNFFRNIILFILMFDIFNSNYRDNLI